MKYFEITRFKRTHPFAVTLVRWCHCADDERGHEWRETCDRFPPKVIRRADGTIEDARTLRDTLRAMTDKTPPTQAMYQDVHEIGRARYQYLTDLELWAYYNNPAHPIANTFRRINPKRRRFLTDEYF